MFNVYYFRAPSPPCTVRSIVGTHDRTPVLGRHSSRHPSRRVPRVAVDRHGLGVVPARIPAKGARLVLAAAEPRAPVYFERGRRSAYHGQVGFERRRDPRAQRLPADVVCRRRVQLGVVVDAVSVVDAEGAGSAGSGYCERLVWGSQGAC
jgi:hypothetical protein